jgi:hypothetical protein
MKLVTIKIKVRESLKGFRTKSGTRLNISINCCIYLFKLIKYATMCETLEILNGKKI